MLEGCGFLRWKGNLICTNFSKFHFSALSHLDGMAAYVNTGGSEDLRLVDRIRVATFREHDLRVEWVTKSWVTKHIRRFALSATASRHT